MQINLVQLFSFSVILNFIRCIDGYDLHSLKHRTKRMFYHSYENYLRNAFPFDELRPLTCDGHDTWGSFSLTLVDSLDTLVVLGNHTEFKRAVELILRQLNPNKNVNVSVFETNIRVIGGLLSAHLLAKRSGMVNEPGWPCHGRLLTLAERFASKILPAFNTPTGMPFGTVNLAYGGVPKNETPITCVATIGTCILEFGTLSRLTGDLRYEEAAIRALRALWMSRSSLGLVGNHINVLTGEWTGKEATIGAGVDSYFEYLLKGSIMFRLPELDAMFRDYRAAIKKNLKFGPWHFMATMSRGSVTSPLYQSLESFWPGVLTLAGDIQEAKEAIVQYHKIWKKYGFLPEMYDITAEHPVNGRAAYPLRPEFIESVMHLYRATRDPYLIEIGIDVLTSIESIAQTPCGFATINDVRTHKLENRMESFFLSETTKYLYLLFDTDNFLHDTPYEKPQKPFSTDTFDNNERCDHDSGGYIFNTEAHPLDSGLIHCCSIQRVHEILQTANILTAQSGVQIDVSNLTYTNDSKLKIVEDLLDHESHTSSLLHTIDDYFSNIMEPSLFWNSSMGTRYQNISTNTGPIEVGSDEWTLNLWDDLSKLMIMPLEEDYPVNYKPAMIRRSPPLSTCPLVPFSVHLQSLQDLDYN